MKSSTNGWVIFTGEYSEVTELMKGDLGPPHSKSKLVGFREHLGVIMIYLPRHGDFHPRGSVRDHSGAWASSPGYRR